MMTASDYLTLYHSAILDPTKKNLLSNVCQIIADNSIVYSKVELSTKVPAIVVAAIHYRESDQNFGRHLHNGDPLSARTKHYPPGRPLLGIPPFTWEASAIDALAGMWRPKQWDLAGSLEFMERYNGLGYQKVGINSPYLWNGTDKYLSGLFIRDHCFDPTVKEDRVGCAAIMKFLEGSNLFSSVLP